MCVCVCVCPDAAHTPDGRSLILQMNLSAIQSVTLILALQTQPRREGREFSVTSRAAGESKVLNVGQKKDKFKNMKEAQGCIKICKNKILKRLKQNR